uniref:sigma factor-like helix-turn-helix DNA-binding protein n=1 Tax=Streptomyces sp. NRRL S-325 TaxID=1463899 RepID=UPI00056A458C|nr:sigma factor-like helix-turn-helix DNA-binding protein [Streptomyces sp. NRRL S-325]
MKQTRRDCAGSATLRTLPYPPSQADVVLLRYRLSLSRGETAELMGMKESEVALELAKALDSLQAQDRQRRDATPVFR